EQWGICPIFKPPGRAPVDPATRLALSEQREVMFIVVLCAILGLMHLYLWKRLVKDTTTAGRTRRLLTAGLTVRGVVLAATLIGPRLIELTESAWFAWPGYLWFGLLAYLFLTLLALEPVRLILRGWVRRGRSTPVEPTATPEPAEPVRPEAAAGLNRRL